MDELRPPTDDEEPPAGLLGDIVLCPAVTARQAAEHDRTPEAEADYLLVHGLLHLLGYDHAEPDEKAEMFGLKDKICWPAGPPSGPTAVARRRESGEPGRLDPADASRSVLVVLAGFIAAAEAACRRCPRRGPTGWSRRAVPGAKRVRQIADDPPRYLNTALFLRRSCEISAIVLVALVVFGIFDADLAAGADHRRPHDRGLVHRSGASRRAPWAGSTPSRSPAPSPARWSRLTTVLGPLPRLLILIGNALTPGKGFADGPFATEAELRELVDLAEAQ